RQRPTFSERAAMRLQVAPGASGPFTYVQAWAWLDGIIASQTRSDQKAARRVCLFAFRAKPRYTPHRPRQDNQTRRPSHHYPEQKCLSRAHSGEFRAKTNSGSRQTTQQETNQLEGYSIKKRIKKTVLLTVPKKRRRNARIPCRASARSGYPADPLFGHDSQTTPIR